MAVVAADRMVTLGGFIEFEHAVPKMASAAGRAVVMVAGDTLTGTRLAHEVSDSLTGAPTVLDIAQRLAERYEATRLHHIEQHILAARGLTLASFYDMQGTLNPQLTFAIDQAMMQFNLGVELLLAGVDDSGAHAYSIHNPGKPEYLHDVIGYAAVGSGAIHAHQSLIGFGHSANAEYHETVFRVYASKRRAEVAPGVGLDTDMAIVSKSGIHWLTPAELDQLKVIYEAYGKATSVELTRSLNDFSLGEDGESTDAVGS